MQLSLWDLRMQKKVLAFHGHTNEYKVCKSIVDQFGSSVIAGKLLIMITEQVYTVS